jgi:GT2 family glycosyltransferase
MKKPDLSIIILNYNSGDFLRKCLESIGKVKKNGFKYEVIVVDNASTDESLKKIQNSKFKIQNENLKLKIIKNEKNLGFAAGNNVGIKKARGRYVLFLNPDTIVMPNTFREMIRFMDDNPQAGAATCRVELPNGKLDEACHRGFPTPWNAFCHFSGLEKLFPKSKVFASYTLGWRPLDKIHEIDSGAGAFLILRKKVGDKLNWWDEDYFWYGEDLDFCYRIKKAGWKIYYVPRVKIIHYKGVSSGIRKESQKMAKADKETKIRAIKASTQAMRIFYKKHYLDKYPRFLTWLVLKGIDFLEKIRLKRLSI